MTKYRVNYGYDLTFDGESPSDVVDCLRKENPFLRDTNNEDDLLRDLAHTATSYNNKSYRFSDRTVFAEDLMKHGILELVG